MRPPPLSAVVERLRQHYGEPARPPVSDALGLILWENVAYLADDALRARVFDALRSRIGLTAAALERAAPEELLAVTAVGKRLPQLQAEKLAKIATLVTTTFGGDLDGALRARPAEAKGALMRFPAIGEPGAEKILALTGLAPVLSLDSNGLRVLLRLGYGVERKTYTQTYRAVQAAAAAQLPARAKVLADAHLLLRTHGKMLCKTTKPLCERCPLNDICPTAPIARNR